MTSTPEGETATDSLPSTWPWKSRVASLSRALFQTHPSSPFSSSFHQPCPGRALDVRLGWGAPPGRRMAAAWPRATFAATRQRARCRELARENASPRPASRAQRLKKIEIIHGTRRAIQNDLNIHHAGISINGGGARLPGTPATEEEPDLGCAAVRRAALACRRVGAWVGLVLTRGQLPRLRWADQRREAERGG